MEVHQELELVSHFANNPELEKRGFKYGFVCIADALGTKGSWRRKEPYRYFDQLNKIHKFLRKQKDKQKEKKRKGKDFHYNYSFYTFSDTIILIMECRNDDDLFIVDKLVHLSHLISSFFIGAMLGGTYYRGAISQGFYIQDSEKFVGPAIDEAAEYYVEKYDWMGITFTPSVNKLIKSMGKRSILVDYINLFPDLKYRYSMIDYSIPSKDGKYFDGNVVNWPKTLTHFLESSEPEIISKFSELTGKQFSPRDWLVAHFKSSVTPDSENKYKKTIDFYDYCIQNRDHWIPKK